MSACGSSNLLRLAVLVPALAAVPLAAAVSCELNDPVHDVPRLFPDSTSYKTSYFSFATKGGLPMLQKIEARLGGFTALYAPLDVPYTLYEVYKGTQRVGYVHGVNQKGQYGVLEVFVSLDLEGRIKAFYIQRMAGRWTKNFTSPKFGSQFLGLTLKDFEQFDVVKGKGSGRLASFVNPSPEAVTDYYGLLRAVNKNLVLMDEFFYSTGKATP